MDFSKFDSMVDVAALKNDVAEAEKNGGNFDKVPYGSYEVNIEKMELNESKKGDPMFSCWFKIVNGDCKDRLIFMNQVVTQGFQIHIVNSFLKELDSGIDVKFDSFTQYNNLIMDIHEAINGKLEYALEYGEKKGFDTFKITEVFEIPF